MLALLFLFLEGDIRRTYFAFAMWVALAVFCGRAVALSLSEEEVLWAWDDGRITYPQVEEILAFLDADDVESACGLWYAYAGAPCAGYEEYYPAELPVRGKIRYAASLDSMGKPYSQSVRAEAAWNRFDVRALWRGKGSALESAPETWRVRYRDRAGEAVLGSLAAGNLRSPFPLSGYTGYAGNVAFKKWNAGALLAVDSSAGLRLGVSPSKNFSALGMGILRPGERSAFARIAVPGAELALAWDARWDTPLASLKFRASGAEPVPWNWSGQVFCHGNDTLPGPFAFAKSVARDAWWISERGSFRVGEWTLAVRGLGEVPADTGANSVIGEFRARRVRERAALGAGVYAQSKNGKNEIRWYELESGIRIVPSESLFVNVRWMNSFLPRWTLGLSHFPHPKVTMREILIVDGRFSEEKPLVFRHSTQISGDAHWACALRFDWFIRPRKGVGPHRLGFMLQGFL